MTDGAEISVCYDVICASIEKILSLTIIECSIICMYHY